MRIIEENLICRVMPEEIGFTLDTCPECSHDRNICVKVRIGRKHIYGAQCEKCGTIVIPVKEYRQDDIADRDEDES